MQYASKFKRIEMRDEMNAYLRGVDFYLQFLPAKLTSRFLLPISFRQIILLTSRYPLLSSRQIDESISIADFFPPN